VGWGLETYFCLTKLFWESGYDVKTQRRRLRRDWLWKFKCDNMWGGWCSNAFNGSSILGCGKTLEGVKNFSRFVRIEVSDGFKIIFWHGVQNLKAAFLELFSMSRYKEASLAEHLQFSSNILQWNITFYQICA
jgi:hypothetical protein